MLREPVKHGQGCAECGSPAGLVCAQCGSVAYCRKEHQRAHWKKHRDQCSPVRVSSDRVLGSFLTATRNLELGELLICEKALAIGPCALSGPVCAGCLRANPPAECSRCGTPVCSTKCQKVVAHTQLECDAVSKTRDSTAGLLSLREHPAVVLPLRCLLGIRFCSTATKSPWTAFLQLEAHLKQREGTAVWAMCQERVVEVLKRHEIIPDNGKEDILVQKICAILDVNSFEVRGPNAESSQGLRAVFTRSALLAHDCIPNTFLAVDDDYVISIRASTHIAKGKPVLYNYSAVLQTTQSRREHLLKGKYFVCTCSRCRDPTELGSHLSSMWCWRCRKGLIVPQVVSGPAPISSSGHTQRFLDLRLKSYRSLPPLPPGVAYLKPLRRKATSSASSRSWLCLCCGAHCSPRAAQAAETLARNLWETCNRRSTGELERLLDRLNANFPPTHSLQLEVKQVLVALYCEISFSAKKPTSQTLKRIEEICQELLDVLEILEPNRASRLKGIALHEQHMATLILSSLECSPTVEAALVFRARKLLEESILHLKLEPERSPEGRLFTFAQDQLRSVQVNLQERFCQFGFL